MPDLILAILAAVAALYLYWTGSLFWIPLAIAFVLAVYSAWYRWRVRRGLRLSQAQLERLVEELNRRDEGK